MDIIILMRVGICSNECGFINSILMSYPAWNPHSFKFKLNPLINVENQTDPDGKMIISTFFKWLS